MKVAPATQENVAGRTRQVGVIGRTRASGGRATGGLSVRAVGAIALLEDRGRAGLAHLGLGHSGAADRTSHDLANRLVGNEPDAACIEATLGMLEILVHEPMLVAVTGAPVEVWCGARMQAINTSFWVPADTTVRLGRDTMAKLGTPPLKPGDVLQVASAAGEAPATDFAPVASIGSERLDLPLILGPRDDWFDDSAIARLARHDFTVTPETDRVGARLQGPELTRRRSGELASEGVVLGALQVPTSGRPTLFLADHPVTGGYPVIGCVPQPWVDRASQATPGQSIRFHPRRLA